MDSDEACSAGYQDVVHQRQLSSPISLLFRAILISKKFACAMFFFLKHQIRSYCARVNVEDLEFEDWMCVR